MLDNASHYPPLSFTSRHSLGGALATLAAGYMALVRKYFSIQHDSNAALWKAVKLRAYT